jgi:predicted ester cyclase
VADDLKAIARRVWLEYRSAGHGLDGIDELIDPSYRRHEPNGAIQITGREGFRKMLEGAHVSMPDVTFSVDDQVAAGDRVVTRWTARATQMSAWRGVEPTARRFSFTGVTISRFVEGRIAEEWVQMDLVSPVEQLRAPA